MTPFPNGTGPANADTGPPAPHAAAGTGGTSAIGRPCAPPGPAPMTATQSP